VSDGERGSETKPGICPLENLETKFKIEEINKRYQIRITKI
jgi:hypothetical protein